MINRETKVDTSAPMLFEPSLSLQFLPGCGQCGERHPLACKPPRNDVVCFSCGGPLAGPGPVTDANVALGGWSPSVLVARACFWAAKQLAKLAKAL